MNSQLSQIAAQQRTADLHSAAERSRRLDVTPHDPRRTARARTRLAPLSPLRPLRWLLAGSR